MCELLLNVYFVILCVILKKDVSSTNVGNEPQDLIICDDKVHPSSHLHGVMMDKDKVPWLGMLHVYLLEFSSKKPAVTGIVLVKYNFAIGNADDIARVPSNVLRSRSRAVFSPPNKDVVYFHVARSMTHDDLNQGIRNTIAIIELKEGKYSFKDSVPICLPKTRVFISSSILLGFSYTDDNGYWEQKLHKLLEVDNHHCKIFYQQNAISANNKWPLKYHCCIEIGNNNTENCVFENGMALVSDRIGNKKGVWTLVGISVRGPGCSLPSRFIDISPYTAWIVDILREDERKKTMELMDMKDLRSGDLRARKDKVDRNYHWIVDFDRITNTSLVVWFVDEKYEYKNGSCNRKSNKLIYRENTTISAIPGFLTIGVYKLTLYDLYAKGYSCMNIKLDCEDRSVAQMFYSIGLDPDITDTPVYDEDKYVIDKRDYSRMLFLNLYVRFTFKTEAQLKIEFYGPMQKKPVYPNLNFLMTLMEEKYWANFFEEQNVNMEATVAPPRYNKKRNTRRANRKNVGSLRADYLDMHAIDQEASSKRANRNNIRSFGSDIHDMHGINYEGSVKRVDREDIGSLEADFHSMHDTNQETSFKRANRDNVRSMAVDFLDINDIDQKASSKRAIVSSFEADILNMHDIDHGASVRRMDRENIRSSVDDFLNMRDVDEEGNFKRARGGKETLGELVRLKKLRKIY